jgi:hypothetical protein
MVYDLRNNERNINWAVEETIGCRSCPEIYQVHNDEKPFALNGAKAKRLKRLKNDRNFIRGL